MTAFRYFTLDEFACKETGENKIDPYFVAWLDAVRHSCGFPFVITSGYRSPRHSIEARKNQPGAHTEGCAADISLLHSGLPKAEARSRIMEVASRMGCNRFGIGKTFLHVDLSRIQPANRTWDYY